MFKNKEYWSYFSLTALLLMFAWVEIGDVNLFIFLAFIPMFLITDVHLRNKKKIIFLFPYVWWAFFLFNLMTTYWIYYASPWGSVGAILSNSLWSALVYLIGVFISSAHYGKLRFYPIVSAWVAWEFLHQYWDLSWTWLTIGNAFAKNPLFVQWYEFTGVLGGTVWVLLINYLLARYLLTFKKHRLTQLGLAFTIPIIASLIIYNYRLLMPTDKAVNVLVIQPNIDPYTEKFSHYGNELLRANLKKSYEKFKTKSVDHVLLPETALYEPTGIRGQTKQDWDAYGIWEKQLYKAAIVQDITALTQGYFPKAGLLSGMDAKDWVGQEKKQENATETYNLQDTTLLLQSYNAAFFYQKKQFQVYNKKKLVVGVELFPFETFLGEWIGSWMADLGGTTGTLGVSENPIVFQDTERNIHIAPIICYESVYGEYVAQFIKKGAQIIYIITNDGWWGESPGYRQHFAYNRLRAIENRKWIARSANTGVSGFIDPLGNITQTLEYGVDGALWQTIYPNNIKTVYSVFGDYLGYLAIGLLSIYWLIYLGRYFFREKQS